MKIKLLIFALLLSVTSSGQGWYRPFYFGTPFNPISNITMIAHTAHAGNGSGAVNATASINTTNATTLIVGVLSAEYNAAPVISDNKGNTWTHVRTEITTSFGRAQFYMCNSLSMSVGTGHIFYTSQTPSFGNPIFVIALGGTLTSGALDQQSGATSASSSTLAPGPLNPTATGEIFITIVESGASAASIPLPTINSSYTMLDIVDDAGFTTKGGGTAYYIRGNASTTNPVWTVFTGSSVHSEAIIISIKTQ